MSRRASVDVRGDWRGVYRGAWERYYSDAHLEAVLRRAMASGINPKKIVDAMTVFSGSSRIERVHPLQFGYVRRKVRTQRQHGMPIVNPLVFYPWRAFDFARCGPMGGAALGLRAILRRVLAGKEAAAAFDKSLRASDGDPDHNAEFVTAFADKIPNTHGAPKREPVHTH